MNKERRKNLEKAIDQIQDCIDLIANIRDEEQEAFDNMPESLQYGERGERMQEYIDTMDNSVSDLEDTMTNLQEILEG